MPKNKNKINLTLTIKPTKPKPKPKPKPIFFMLTNIYLKHFLIPTTKVIFCKDNSYTDYYFFKEIPFSLKHIKVKEDGHFEVNNLNVFLDVSPFITTEDYEKVFIKNKDKK